ncbi:zinc ribbon domain-containing protein [Guptibacillus hwajinpoensis]|uniref:zinc ribbon domain-containing protein n=1 Tax=Guptibacillus hwajinpoensis TaxID=208199 RepID=UPI001CFDAFE8|nr:hypothetical protein [Pseudalkalibacillus hwajinpoensis]WLR61537.1 hypothetical protein LC071_09740 [Pseudalkalibacillus hwajinpoensis]
MKFCTSCGKEAKDKEFCQHCGAKLGSNNLMNKPQVKPSPAGSKKRKILLGSVLALIIIVFAVFKVGESYTDKFNQLSKFEENLNQGNVKELVSLLESSDSTLEVSDKNVKSLLTYLKENPDEKETLIDHLRDTASSIDMKQQVSAEGKEESNQLIKMEKQGKKFFVYDNYDFILQPFPLLIDTNEEKVSYLVDGKKVSHVETKGGLINLGSFLPGEYKVEGNLSSELMNLSKEINVRHFEKNNYSVLEFDVETISIQSNVEKFDVLINGKNTDVSFTDGKQVELDSVMVDGSMTAQVQADAPFGKIKSSDVAIDDTYLEVETMLSDKQKEKVVQSLKQHLTNYSNALINREIDFLDDNSTFVSDYTYASFENLIAYSTNYAGYLTDAKVDWDTFYIDETDGKWTLEVGLVEKWKENDAYDGKTSSLSESRYSNLYTLTYDSKDKWNVVNWASYDDASSNVKDLGIDLKKQKKDFEASTAFKTNSDEEEQSSQSNDELDVESFVQTYVSTYVEAINYDDFSIISDQIDPSSNSYLKEVSSYIDHLNDKGMKEELISVDVQSVEASGAGYTVSTVEKYNIYYSDGSEKNKAYRSTYQVNVTSDGMKMGKLIETKEI